jgi:hypothetical protein
MATRGLTHLETIGASFVSNSITTRPTDAAYDALNTGISRMTLRRRWGTARRAYDQTLLNITISGANAPPVLANALVNQTGNEGTALSYQFASNTFTDTTGTPLTYTATLADGSALPGWITFTAGTRTFSGTRPLVTETTVITVRVTATDIYNQTASGTFTITNTNVP